MRIASVVVLLAAVAPTIAAQNTSSGVPGVDVWISTPSVALAHNEPVAAHAVADPQAYVVVFRVTPDSRIIVVAPRTPYGAYRVPKVGLRPEGVDVSFRTEQTDGVGYLFAAASYTPFDFSRVRSGGTWNTGRLGIPPSHKDVIDVADWFVQQIVPSHSTPYGINDVAYYVGVTPQADENQNAQQDALDNTQQSGSQNTVVYVTPAYDEPLYYDQYGYSAYAWGPYPYVPVYGNNFYWYDPYANSRGGYVKRCPDGSVVSVRVACPVVLNGRHSRDGGHRIVPRKPTPPHLIPARPLRRSLPLTMQVQTLPPAPLLSPSALDERRSAPHNTHPAPPRPVPVGVYNRPITLPPPVPRPAPPSHPAPQEPARRR